MRFRVPSGTSFLMVGSGIYWILSSQLIASFTVLTPHVFLSDPTAITLVLIVGVLTCVAGLWIINDDLDQMIKVLNRRDGWLYLTPILLSACDLAVTLIGLSSSTAVVELNPLIASAVHEGPSVFAAFTVSYMTLSAGLTLLMLHTGKFLFPSSHWRFLSFSMICGVGSFGLLNNLVILAAPTLSEFSLVGATAGALMLGTFVYESLVRDYRSGFGSASFLAG